MITGEQRQGGGRGCNRLTKTLEPLLGEFNSLEGEEQPCYL